MKVEICDLALTLSTRVGITDCFCEGPELISFPLRDLVTCTQSQILVQLDGIMWKKAVRSEELLSFAEEVVLNSGPWAWSLAWVM